MKPKYFRLIRTFDGVGHYYKVHLPENYKYWKEDVSISLILH